MPSAPDQVWAAQITFVHLAKAFTYLAVILNAFSRKAVGWVFDNTIDTSPAITARVKAITMRELGLSVGHRAMLAPEAK